MLLSNRAEQISGWSRFEYPSEYRCFLIILNPLCVTYFFKFLFPVYFQSCCYALSWAATDTIALAWNIQAYSATLGSEFNIYISVYISFSCIQHANVPNKPKRLKCTEIHKYDGHNNEVKGNLTLHNVDFIVLEHNKLAV